MKARRLLLVDDDEAYLSSLQEALEAYGYRVLVAESRDQAAAILDRDGIHAALVDLSLMGRGDEDGLEVIRRVKTTDPQVPAVLITAYGGPEIAQRAADAGADRYLEKPISVRQVIELLGDFGLTPEADEDG